MNKPFYPYLHVSPNLSLYWDFSLKKKKKYSVCMSEERVRSSRLTCMYGFLPQSRHWDPHTQCSSVQKLGQGSMCILPKCVSRLHGTYLFGCFKFAGLSCLQIRGKNRYFDIWHFEIGCLFQAVEDVIKAACASFRTRSFPDWNFSGWNKVVSVETKQFTTLK